MVIVGTISNSALAAQNQEHESKPDQPAEDRESHHPEKNSNRNVTDRQPLVPGLWRSCRLRQWLVTPGAPPCEDGILGTAVRTCNDAFCRWRGYGRLVRATCMAKAIARHERSTATHAPDLGVIRFSPHCCHRRSVPFTIGSRVDHASRDHPCAHRADHRYHEPDQSTRGAEIAPAKVRLVDSTDENRSRTRTRSSSQPRSRGCQCRQQSSSVVHRKSGH